MCYHGRMNKTDRILKIVHDEDCPSPREHDNLGTLACGHRRMTLGDVQPKEDPISYQQALPKDTLIVPVYMLDHSGVALSTKDFNDPWDSGQVGLYTITPAKLIEAYGEDTPETREQARQGIQAELEEYTDYLNGNAWGFVIEDAEGNHIDSCFGFLGSDPTENGMTDHLSDADLDLIEGAMDKAGLFLAQGKMESVKTERAVRRAGAPKMS